MLPLHLRSIAARVAIAVLAVAPTLAVAQPLQLSLRQLHNISHFQTVRQQAMELRLPGRDRLLVAHRAFALDWVFAAGDLSWEDGASRFVSVGRGIRWRPLALVPRSELQFSLSPTWVEHPRLAGRELGGHFHFTSALAWVLPLDAAGRRTLSLRLQHTSNAGSQAENPGLDLAGIEFGWRFGRPAPLAFPARRPATVALDFRWPIAEPLSPYQSPG